MGRILECVRGPNADPVGGARYDLSTDPRPVSVAWLWFGGRTGGAEGDRTPDLRAASAALSQLSYGPGKVVRVYAPSMGVSTWAGLLLPVLLGGAAPEGLEAVVVASFVGEDVDHYVEEVEADPGSPFVEALGARTVALLDHALDDLLGHAAHLALGLGAGYHEVVRVGDETPKVYKGNVMCEHLARRPGYRGGHLISERLTRGTEVPLPGDRLVASHRISSFTSPPSVGLPSPL